MLAETQTAPSSILGVLGEHLLSCPEQVCCCSLAFRGEQATETLLTFASLADDSWQVAAELTARGARAGDRVLLALQDPVQFVACFFGALTAGLIAVPLPALGEFGTPVAAIDRIKGVCHDCAPKLAITESKARWDAVVGKSALSCQVLEVDELGLSGPGRPTPVRFPDLPGSAPAFIQYTSGSTGKPRGVVVTHANILANVRGIGLAAGFGPNERFVSWLPLHHDMGLIGGVLTPLYWKFPTVLFTPASFIARPVLWLRTISKYRATVSPAPTFAYNLCCRCLSRPSLQGLDLSSWRFAFIGAENIPLHVVQGFLRRFQPHGFAPTSLYPVYGLAEATLEVTAPDPGEGVIIDRVELVRRDGKPFALPKADGDSGGVAYVAVGRVLPGHELLIVDPVTHVVCAEREVGAIVVKGPSVTPRYYDEDEGCVREQLHTGDLGYLANGRLYVIDRLKDLIIIAGQNYAPADIEACLARIPAISVERCAAFSLPSNAGTEALFVAMELGAKNKMRVGEIQRQIVQMVREHSGLAVAQVFCLPRGALPRTTSGKIQRGVCKELARSGVLAHEQYT